MNDRVAMGEMMWVMYTLEIFTGDEMREIRWDLYV